MQQNQFCCLFLTRKGKCKYDGPCELRPLLIKNGADNKKKSLVVFLKCYQRNLKKSKKAGKQFFRTVFKKVTKKQMKSLSEYETNILLDAREEKPSRTTCMFRVPENIEKFEKIWNK